MGRTRGIQYTPMKKIYTAPLTMVVKIKAEQIICSSPLPPEVVGKSATGDALSKDDFSADDLGRSAILDAIASDDEEDMIDELW